MIPADLRKDFTIFIALPTDEANTEMKSVLMEAGFETLIFSTQESMMGRIEEIRPHIILFSPEALSTTVSEFVEAVLKENDEIQFAVVSSADMSDALSEYREYNFAAMIVEGEQVTTRAAWAMDQICETLYRTYQNEKLLEKVGSAPVAVPSDEKTAVLNVPAGPAAASAPVPSDLNAKINHYQFAVTKDDYIEIFLKQVTGRAIYFKFLPTVGSFVSTFSQGMDLEDIKDVGIRLSFEESKDVDAFFQAGKVPESLKELLSEGLQVTNFATKPVFTMTGLDGIFIFWNNNESQLQRIETDFTIFNLMYTQGSLLKRLESVDTLDSVIEINNQRYFERTLELELSRAKRYQSPVSVVRISVDHLDDIKNSFGPSNRDLILKTLGSMIKKTSRPTDVTARTGENQISLILPHCPRKGAALRAERLRRIVEAHSFPIPDLKITISCGVSEYPSLSRGSEDLDTSAGKALEFIRTRGGNKVCLFKPAQEIKPDFEVR